MWGEIRILSVQLAGETSGIWFEPDSSGCLFFSCSCLPTVAASDPGSPRGMSTPLKI